MAYIFIVLCALSNILTAVLTNLLTSLPLGQKEFLFGVLTLLNGVFSNVYIIGMVLAVELVGPRFRLLASNAFYYAYIIGELVVLGFALAVDRYDLIQVCMAVFMSLFVFYFWLIPESPRFLVTQSRYREASRVFQRIAVSNNKPFERSRVGFNRNESDNESEIERDETALLVNNSESSNLNNQATKKVGLNYIEF